MSWGYFCHNIRSRTCELLSKYIVNTGLNGWLMDDPEFSPRTTRRRLLRADRDESEDGSVVQLQYAWFLNSNSPEISMTSGSNYLAYAVDPEIVSLCGDSDTRVKGFGNTNTTTADQLFHLPQGSSITDTKEELTYVMAYGISKTLSSVYYNGVDVRNYNNINFPTTYTTVNASTGANVSVDVNETTIDWAFNGVAVGETPDNANIGYLGAIPHSMDMTKPYVLTITHHTPQWVNNDEIFGGQGAQRIHSVSWRVTQGDLEYSGSDYQSWPGAPARDDGFSDCDSIHLASDTGVIIQMNDARAYGNWMGWIQNADHDRVADIISRMTL